MGHRALIAYERPDSTYNCHYSHWGAQNLRLKPTITNETPFAGDEPNEVLRTVHRQLRQATTDRGVARVLDAHDLPTRQVDIEPWTIRLTVDEIIDEHLDFLHYEAFYVVDSDCRVTAYRTHWFGLQYDCEVIDEAPTVGNGALRTVRWYEGEPVGDGFAQGEFRGLKATVGDMLDRGAFTWAEAIEYMAQQLDAWVDDTEELIVRKPQLIE
ncbi:hypothetical protein C475_19663 [Halosimplex carlsbadense 2-9-1]|uniref:Uncharacterized protein n=1 Tax=Halosimplex carlsbadense 2-9-1 TaxID=797114 RepID=M0CC82_9EURY|nr:DUF6735 family protein [Halosimplex carlsbadense]ELZ20850.1 hypothetical protein C475_19663 [Halosimplex carlsbadense 2-9-1]